MGRPTSRYHLLPEEFTLRYVTRWHRLQRSSEQRSDPGQGEIEEFCRWATTSGADEPNTIKGTVRLLDHRDGGGGQPDLKSRIVAHGNLDWLAVPNRSELALAFRSGLVRPRC